MSQPLVSVAMIVYNHEAFLSQAIESILCQKTDFDFEIIISEDCSTDGSRAIIKSYAEEYSAIIKPIYNEQNLGMQKNFGQCLNACTGKYIATLEGDDYWTDIYKLQKQKDFLEANPDFTMCFSAIDTQNELGLTKIRNYSPPSGKEVINIEDIIETYSNCFIATATLFFRNILPDPMPMFFYKAFGGDISLHLFLTNQGKAKFLNEKTAVYRVHQGGIMQTKKFIMGGERNAFDLFDNFNDYTNGKYHEQIKKVLFPISQTLLMYGSGLLKGKERRDHIFRMLKGYNKYRPSFNFKEIAYYNVVLFFPLVLKIHKFLSKK